MGVLSGAHIWGLKMDRDAIINQLKIDEGFSASAYFDRTQWTYGYGCCAPGQGSIISEETAAILLGRRVDQAIQEFHEIFADQPMDDVRQGALVNMVFNLGKGGVEGFHNMIAAIKADNWDGAADQAMDSLWYRQLKNSGNPPGRSNRIVQELRKGADV